MYLAGPSTTNGIKYSQYVYDRLIKYQWNKVLTVCIQENYQLPMT